MNVLVRVLVLYDDRVPLWGRDGGGRQLGPAFPSGGPGHI